MNKLWGIGGIVGLVLLTIIALGGKEQSEPEVLTIGGGFERGCTASTTAWSVGPQESTTVLPAKGARASFTLSMVGANTTGHYRLDSTAANITNGHPISATSTVNFNETYPYRGVVTAASAASTTMLVTECLYTN